MDHTKELIKCVRDGDQSARNRLVEENMGLVYATAKKYLGRGYEMEDLTQIGVIGLIKSIDRFDLNIEVQFSTYAVVMIVGEIKRFLRDDGMVKVSRSIKENGLKVRRANAELSNQLMREPTLEEIALKSELAVEDVVVAQDAMQEVESIHKTIYSSEGNEIYLVDRLAQEKDEKEEVLNHMLLNSLLNDLSQEEKRLIQLRYFEDKTQSEVAKEFGISQVQVSRMEKKILLAMRKKVV